MIEYQFVDKDSNTFDPNGVNIESIARKSFTSGADSHNFEQKLIEKSFLSGMSKVGDPRLASRSLDFELSWIATTDVDFDDFINEYLYWLNKTVIIKDLTNLKQCKVAILDANISHDSGSYKRSGDLTLSFSMLDSFWFSTIATESEHILTAGTTDIPINNEGWLKTYPILTLDVQDPAPQLDIFIVENKEGIQVIDSSLGTLTLNDLVIDCVNGSLTISDFDRTESITERTGYFPFPVGNSTLRIITPVDITLDISYFKRYYS